MSTKRHNRDSSPRRSTKPKRTTLDNYTIPLSHLGLTYNAFEDAPGEVTTLFSLDKVILRHRQRGSWSLDGAEWIFYELAYEVPHPLSQDEARCKLGTDFDRALLYVKNVLINEWNNRRNPKTNKLSRKERLAKIKHLAEEAIRTADKTLEDENFGGYASDEARIVLHDNLESILDVINS